MEPSASVPNLKPPPISVSIEIHESPLTDAEQDLIRSYELAHCAADSNKSKELETRVAEFFRSVQQMDALKWRYVLEQYVLFPLVSSVEFREKLLDQPQWSLPFVTFFSRSLEGKVLEKDKKEELQHLHRALLTILAKLLEYHWQNRLGLGASLEQLFALLAQEAGWTKPTCDFARMVLTTIANLIAHQADVFRHSFGHVCWPNLFDYCATLEDFLFYKPSLIRRAATTAPRTAGMHLDQLGCRDAPAVERLLTLLEKLKAHSVKAELYEPRHAKVALVLRERTLREKTYWQRIHVLLQTIRLMDQAETARTPIKAITAAWKELRRPPGCKMISKKVLKDALYAMVEFMSIHRITSKNKTEPKPQPSETGASTPLDVSTKNLYVLPGYDRPGFGINASETSPSGLRTVGVGGQPLGGQEFRASISKRRPVDVNTASTPSRNVAALLSPRKSAKRPSLTASPRGGPPPSLSSPTGDYSGISSPRENGNMMHDGCEVEATTHEPSTPKKRFNFALDVSPKTAGTVGQSKRSILSRMSRSIPLRAASTPPIEPVTSSPSPPSSATPPGLPTRVKSTPGSDTSSSQKGQKTQPRRRSDLDKSKHGLDVVPRGVVKRELELFGKLLASGSTKSSMDKDFVERLATPTSGRRATDSHALEKEKEEKQHDKNNKITDSLQSETTHTRQLSNSFDNTDKDASSHVDGSQTGISLSANSVQLEDTEDSDEEDRVLRHRLQTLDLRAQAALNHDLIIPEVEPEKGGEKSEQQQQQQKRESPAKPALRTLVLETDEGDTQVLLNPL
eukprot:g12163.t1